MIVDTNKKPKTKVVVLKSQIDRLEVQGVVDKQKAKFFRRFLKSPNPDDIHVHSLVMTYEPLMILSGTYEADFFRKAIHEIKVDRNVKEIFFEGGIFPASNYAKAVSFSSKIRKNVVSLEVEEHVFVAEEKEIILDHHGKPRDFIYKADAKDVENYPNRILKKNTVKEIEITEQAAIKKLAKSLQSHETFDDVRDLNESLAVSEIAMIYIPIYEARLIGPKKKVEILRLDAVKKKLL